MSTAVNNPGNGAVSATESTASFTPEQVAASEKMSGI